MKLDNKRSKACLTSRKLELYEKNAEIIGFLQRNPVFSSEFLLGLKLLDGQKYILNQVWTAQYVALAACRNFG